MPYKNPEDRKAFDRRRKAEAREANPIRVGLLGRQQKQLARVDRSADAAVRKRPTTIRQPIVRKDSDPLVGEPTYIESRGGNAEFRTGRRTRQPEPGEVSPTANEPAARLARELADAGRGLFAHPSWENVLPTDLESDEARAVALAIYQLSGPNPDRSTGPPPQNLADLAQVPAHELAVTLRALTMRGRVYVTEGGNLSLMLGQEASPEPWHVCLQRLNAILRGGRNHIDESFELADAFKDGGENDLSRADLLGA